MYFQMPGAYLRNVNLCPTYPTDYKKNLISLDLDQCVMGA